MSASIVVACHFPYKKHANCVFAVQKTDLIGELIESGKTEPFDLVVDDVGQPADLYKESHLYLKPEGKFISIGSKNDIASLAARTLPTFLGGGRRKSEQVHVLLGTHRDDLVQLGRWMAQGKIKAVIDSTYPLADAAEAYAKLKGGHTHGKIVIRVGAKQ